MYRFGQPEIDALTRIIKKQALWRHAPGSECERFEKRYADYLGVKYAQMSPSGTTAITAALVGVGVGPGDEVIVPCHTYMASAVSVLAAGAIPLICDVDESLTLDPVAFEKMIGPRTKAVMPVHIWGVCCDMKSIMRIARKHNLKVVEDACQAVGGGYEGKMLGAIGHAGAFSFNYYKHMTCGEGGAVVTNNRKVFDLARCMVDCCGFYWKGRKAAFPAFTSNGSRTSELEGAVMNVQLDRIGGMIDALRAEKKRILDATASTGLTPAVNHSPDDECGANVIYLLPNAATAARFAEAAGGTVAGKTGRHVYTEWDPVLAHNGAHHPGLNPYKLKENRGCRRTYRKDQCKKSLGILNRAVKFGTHPDHKKKDTDRMIKRIRDAAASLL